MSVKELERESYGTIAVPKIAHSRATDQPLKRYNCCAGKRDDKKTTYSRAESSGGST